MTKRRGTLFEVNSALNKPTTKFGVDYRLLGICMFVSITVFLFASKILACLLLPMLICAAICSHEENPKCSGFGCSVSGSPVSMILESAKNMANPKWFEKAKPTCSVVPIRRFVNEHVFALKTGGYGCMFAIDGILC